MVLYVVVEKRYVCVWYIVHYSMGVVFMCVCIYVCWNVRMCFCMYVCVFECLWGMICCVSGICVCVCVGVLMCVV